MDAASLILITLFACARAIPTISAERQLALAGQVHAEEDKPACPSSCYEGLQCCLDTGAQWPCSLNQEGSRCNCDADLKIGPCQFAADARDHMQTKLGNVPMVMSHDSTTGYPHKLNIVGTCANYQSQTIGISGQLDCGVRAFDMRVFARDGDIRIVVRDGDAYPVSDTEYEFCHGPTSNSENLLRHKFELNLCSALEEAVNWANDHPSELVILLYSHLTGLDGSDWTNYVERVRTCGKLPAIKHTCTNSEDLGNLSLIEAMKLSKVPDGHGHVLAVFEDQSNSCVEDNYGPFHECEFDKFDCLNDATRDVLKDKPRGVMYQVQRIWQWSFASPIIDVNAMSKLNEKTRDFSEQAKAKGGLWLIDNVCTDGFQLARALGTVVTNGDAAKCTASCGNSERKCLSEDKQCAAWGHLNGCCRCYNDDKLPAEDCNQMGSTADKKCDECSNGAWCGNCGNEYGWLC